MVKYVWIVILLNLDLNYLINYYGESFRIFKKIFQKVFQEKEISQYYMDYMILQYDNEIFLVNKQIKYSKLLLNKLDKY